MRVLFYYPWELDFTGGAEVSVLALGAALVKRGHHVGIVDQMPPTPSPWLRPWVIPFECSRWTVPVPIPRRLRSWWRVSGTLRLFWGIVALFKPNVVSVQAPAWQSVPVAIASTLPHRWRLVVTAHGSDVRDDLDDEPRLRKWLGRLCQRADAATAVSQSLWQDFVREFPIVARKGRVIHNGVDSAWFDSAGTTCGASGTPFVLFVGRLHPVKGADLLLRAWKLVRAPAPEPALWLAGEGPAEGDLRALAQQLGIADRVRFLGWVSQADLPSLYRRAQLVVMPSRNEGLSRVALEAGACGAICVATRVGGTPEIIDDGVTGVLTAPSFQALADALTMALQLSPDARRQMSTAATSRIRRDFHHDRTVAAYEALFRSLLEPSARPA